MILADLHPLAQAAARDLSACLATAPSDRVRAAIASAKTALEGAGSMRDLTRAAHEARYALGELRVATAIEAHAAHVKATSGAEHADAARKLSDAASVVRAAEYAVAVIQEGTVRMVEEVAARLARLAELEETAADLDPGLLVLHRDAAAADLTRLGICAKGLRALKRPESAEDLVAWHAAARGAENARHHAEAVSESWDTTASVAHYRARMKLEGLRDAIELLGARAFGALLPSIRASGEETPSARSQEEAVA